jgi:hypothetical protein
MVAAVMLAALALRAGLALRRGRRGRGRRTAAMRRAHLRVAKVAVAMVLLGFLAGPPSAVALRGWEPFHTFHGVVGVLVALLFTTAFALGYRLERARSRAFDAHALVGILAVGVAALAAMAGFVLLP